MPLEDAIISHNSDGTLNEDYCQWCFADGTYTYSDMDDLIDVCVQHMVKDEILISVDIIVVATVMIGIWFMSIQKRFSLQ